MTVDSPRTGATPYATASSLQPKHDVVPGLGAEAEAERQSQIAPPFTSKLPRPMAAMWRKFCFLVTWVPPRCRWDPEKPPQFSMSLNLLFAFAGSFTVANLYYSHPILNILAHDFGVPYEKVSQIPTVAQAGYASGLLFLCPLGDLFPRRPFVIWLVFFTATMWIGLCVTSSLAAFTAITFITAVSTVTPQLMLPLVGELAPPNRRGAALSIVASGLMLGILIARVLSGTITNYVSWRIVYWMSLGLQYFIFFLLWLCMPDYPSSNPQGLNYFKMLWSILVMLTKHAVLVQACLISFFTSATFTSFWTTLTFLLAGPPYHYSSVTIGLFGFIGIAVMLLGPLYARLVTDRFVPLFSVIVGVVMGIIGITVGTYTGTFTIAGPVIQALFCDLGFQTASVANRSSIYSIEPKARNRVNTAFMVWVFCGQLMGTAAGNHIYAAGGWIRSGSASVGFILAALLCCLVRGPYEEGWVGWSGGYSMLKKDRNSADGKTVERAAYTKEEDASVENANATVDVEKGAVEKTLDELAAKEQEYTIADGSATPSDTGKTPTNQSSDNIAPVPTGKL